MRGPVWLWHSRAQTPIGRCNAFPGIEKNNKFHPLTRARGNFYLTVFDGQRRGATTAGSATAYTTRWPWPRATAHRLFNLSLAASPPTISLRAAAAAVDVPASLTSTTLVAAFLVAVAVVSTALTAIGHPAAHAPPSLQGWTAYGQR